jgi:hypothetical protein
MVPLSSDASKDASSLGGEFGDLGWSQGLFGHDLYEMIQSLYLTADSTASYIPNIVEPDQGEVTETVMQGSAVTAATWTSLAGISRIYGYFVDAAPYDGAFELFEPDMETTYTGFISEDASVNVSANLVDQYQSAIKLELTK